MFVILNKTTTFVMKQTIKINNNENSNITKI